MVWMIVASALVVLGLAAMAGTGRFGEMPGPVNDRPRPVLPEVPYGPEYLARLRLPRTTTGYDPGQVDEYLRRALTELPDGDPLFDVVRGGYDMQAADLVIEEAMRSASRQAMMTEVRNPDHVSSEELTSSAVISATPGSEVSQARNAE